MKELKTEQKKVKEMRVERSIEGIPATVEDILGRTGFRGELTQVLAKIIDGVETGKTIRRNVKGPVRIKDVIMLRETQIEARKIRTKIMKGAFT